MIFASRVGLCRFVTQSPRSKSLREAVLSKDLKFWSHKALLPVGYPDSVTKNYIKFVKLNMAQVVCISLTRILSTQAMLLAVGLGQGGALPMAAVMSWLLKDGLGHLGSVLAGTSINVKFDSDPKKYKFISMSLGQGANLLAILSLAKPGMFLVLTALSSALSRIGTLAVTASRARIYENFSARGNLGDLMRCSQAQSTVATLIGTGIGIMLSPIVGTDVNSILSVFAPVSVATHALAYKAVSVIELPTLNVQRMHLVMETWVNERRAPTCSEVATREGILLSHTPRKIVINPDIRDFDFGKHVIDELVEKKFIILHSAEGVKNVWIKDDARSKDCIRAMFEASGGQESEWPVFTTQLREAGWDLSVAFIDNVDYRIRVSS
jgi:hypothetical protein